MLFGSTFVQSGVTLLVPLVEVVSKFVALNPLLDAQGEDPELNTGDGPPTASASRTHAIALGWPGMRRLNPSTCLRNRKNNAIDRVEQGVALVPASATCTHSGVTEPAGAERVVRVSERTVPFGPVSLSNSNNRHARARRITFSAGDRSAPAVPMSASPLGPRGAAMRVHERNFRAEQHWAYTGRSPRRQRRDHAVGRVSPGFRSRCWRRSATRWQHSCSITCFNWTFSMAIAC